MAAGMQQGREDEEELEEEEEAGGEGDEGDGGPERALEKSPFQLTAGDVYDISAVVGRDLLQLRAAPRVPAALARLQFRIVRVLEMLEALVSESSLAEEQLRMERDSLRREVEELRAARSRGSAQQVGASAAGGARAAGAAAARRHKHRGGPRPVGLGVVEPTRAPAGMYRRMLSPQPPGSFTPAGASEKFSSRLCGRARGVSRAELSGGGLQGAALRVACSPLPAGAHLASSSAACRAGGGARSHAGRASQRTSPRL